MAGVLALGTLDARLFALLWTAKEAVLKKAGVGLTELSKCRWARQLGADSVELEHAGALHRADHRELQDYVVALSGDDPTPPTWHLASEDAR